MTNSNKRDKDYVIDHINRAINELVIPKIKLQKYYNYYNGKRDVEQFRYLEENYGIGNPTSLEFTPLIKKHVDALIGEYLGTPLLPKVSCKDRDTLSKIHDEKEKEINNQLYGLLTGKINNQILNFIQGKDIKTESVEETVQALMEDINDNFVSQYEIAAQNIIEYIIQNSDIDLMNKLWACILDLLVGGGNYYKPKPSLSGTNICIDVCDPLNTFVDRNPSSKYVKDGYRCVIRRWYTQKQILHLYGDKLDKDAIEELDQTFRDTSDFQTNYIRTYSNTPTPRPGIDSEREVVPGFPVDNFEYSNYRLIPVYEVEWIEADKEDGEYILNRYEGVRIGMSIFIPTGKSQNIIRNQDNPKHCTLSLGGTYLLNRNNVPYSLVGACIHLQDKYDITTYLRDTIIAGSGTVGQWIDVSMLPAFLGDDLTERVLKFDAYRKAGKAIVDTSQDGRAFNNNTSFAGFDDTIKATTIQGFDMVLDRIESTCSSITGVFRERLNGIQQRDAVSNIQTGIQNSYTVTRTYYQQMDTLVRDMLMDSLNLAKIVWKKGLTGVLVLGDKMQKVFTALPEHFTLTDYDIHIVSSSQILTEMKNIQGVITEFIKSGQLDADIIVDALTARSITELRNKVSKAVSKKKKYDQAISDLQRQLEEAQKQLQQLDQRNKQLKSKLDSVNAERLEIEKSQAQSQSEIAWYNAQSERTYKEASIEVENKKLDAEIMQLRDGNPFNDQIRTD